MRFLGMVFLLSLFLCLSGMSAFADGTVQVKLNVQYGQTEARSMVSMINEFRTGNDAWYWNSDNATKTTLSNLETLTYDYDLEAIAMQRAAEIALSFSHTRPNGTSCFSLSNRNNSMGENIAAGHGSAASAFVGWQENDDDYSGQGHRRNMLSARFNCVGIGHVVYNGYHFWVQEFGTKITNSTASAANDAASAVTVEVADTSIMNFSAIPDPCILSYGATAKLPGLQIKIQTGDTWPSRAVPVMMDYVWSAADTSCISVSGGMISGKKAGTANLTTTVLGRTVTASVTVTPASLDDAVINLESSTFSYTGAAVTPPVTSVTRKGTVLIEGTDYTVSYTDNQKPGTGKVNITGIGNYTGTASKTFTIICRHDYNAVRTKEPTCSADGVMTYTCKICKDSYTEAIKATGAHSYGEPSFTWAKNGQSATAVFICSSGGEKKNVTAEVSNSSSSQTQYVYTAKVELNGKTYSDTKTVARETVTVNETFKKGGLNYKVTKVSGKKGTATVTSSEKVTSTSLTIPKTVTFNSVVLTVNAIGNNAFKNMKKLKTVSVGANVTKIGTNAFYGCTALTSVGGCSGVTTIGSKAFYQCTKLVTVGASSGSVKLAKVKTIGNYAFMGCKKIRKVNLTSKVLTSIGTNAFQNCTAMTTLSVSSPVLSKIGSKAFYQCSKLTNVTLKTTKLTKARVGANAFKRIKATCTFKVPSSKVSSYKTIFRAKGASAKIKVKKV